MGLLSPLRGRQGWVHLVFEFGAGRDHKAGLVGPALPLWNWLGRSKIRSATQNVKYHEAGFRSPLAARLGESL